MKNLPTNERNGEKNQKIINVDTIDEKPSNLN